MSKHQSFRALVGTVREETLNGRAYLVAPVVALVEGVIWSGNSSEPSLALADEFAPTPAAWDGRPVTVDHPQLNGQFVSANLPEIWDTVVIGQMFNSERDDDRLLSEIWLDIAKAEELGFIEVVENFRNNIMMEVSTGLFASSEEQTGELDGERFFNVWRDVLPDHLAILPDTIGACSIEDGCGAPRLNSAWTSAETKEVFMNLNSLKKIITGKDGTSLVECDCPDPSDCSCGTGQGNASATNLNEKHETENENTNELKTESTDPVNGGEESDLSTNAEIDHSSPDTIFARLAESPFDILDGFNSAPVVNELSDTDMREALLTALTQAGHEVFRIAAVYNGSVVFETWDSNKLWSQSFIGNGDENLPTLNGERMEVRSITQFVPVDQLEINMSKEEKVAALIANERTHFTEDHQEFLMGLEEDQLDLFDPIEAAQSDEGEAPLTHEQPQDEVTVESYLADAPEEVRAVLNAGIKREKSYRKELTDSIKANSRNQFSEAELEGMDTDMLEKLNAMNVAEADFSGAAGVVNSAPAEDQNEVPAPPAVFEKKIA